MCVPGCDEAVRRALSRRGLFRGAAAASASFAAVGVTPAQAQRSFSTVIDLTHTLTPEFPTFFGVPGILVEKKYSLKKDGANVNWWHVVEHAGTHIDAPVHFSDAGAALEQIAAEQLVVPLAVVDVSAKAARNRDYELSKQDLADWESKNGRLPGNCCVAMHSGWARHANDPAKFTGKDAAGTMHFPVFILTRPNGCSRSVALPVSRSIRSRSITGRPKTSRHTRRGCLPAAGASKTSPISIMCRPRARRSLSARQR